MCHCTHRGIKYRVPNSLCVCVCLRVVCQHKCTAYQIVLFFLFALSLFLFPSTPGRLSQRIFHSFSFIILNIRDYYKWRCELRDVTINDHFHLFIKLHTDGLRVVCVLCGFNWILLVRCDSRGVWIHCEYLCECVRCVYFVTFIIHFIVPLMLCSLSLALYIYLIDTVSKSIKFLKCRHRVPTIQKRWIN